MPQAYLVPFSHNKQRGRRQADRAGIARRYRAVAFRLKSHVLNANCKLLLTVSLYSVTVTPMNDVIIDNNNFCFIV